MGYHHIAKPIYTPSVGQGNDKAVPERDRQDRRHILLTRAPSDMLETGKHPQEICRQSTCHRIEYSSVQVGHPLTDPFQAHCPGQDGHEQEVAITTDRMITGVCIIFLLSFGRQLRLPPTSSRLLLEGRSAGSSIP